MAEESTTPDLEVLARRSVETCARGDPDRAVILYEVRPDVDEARVAAERPAEERG